MRRSFKIGLAALIALIMIGGVAVAAWLSTGTGTGTAKAGSPKDLTVTKVALTTGDLYPGSGNGTVYVNVKNNNSYPVTLTGATLTELSAPVECKVTVNSGGHFTVLAPTSIDAGDEAQIGIPNALSMGLDAADTCKEVEFTVAATVNAQAGS